MYRKNLEDYVIDSISYLYMSVFAFFCLLPFLLIITSSFTDERTLLQNGFSLFPEKTSTMAYQVIFKGTIILDAYKVTIFITFVGSFISLVFTSAIAYVLSVQNFKPRNKIAFFIYFTMLFNGGLVPTYLLISKYLNMKDTIWVYIIPALINPYNMFLLRNFFKSIPSSLSESAKIDGANDIFILFRIILPLSKPALATIGLFYALGYWNEWFSCLLYISNQKLVTLQYLIMKIIRSMVFLSEINSLQQSIPFYFEFTPPTNTVKMATAVVTVGPIIFLYPFVQRYFVKGIVVGAIKG